MAEKPKFDPGAEYQAEEEQKGFNPDAPVQGESSETQKPEPGWLDKEIPLTSYPAAFEQGAQTLARGGRDAITGLGSMIAHPIDTLKSFGDVPGQVAQVPGAIHDINRSADPLGTYAKVGQETAGQGAAQAGLALAGEGLARAPYGRILRTAGKGIADQPVISKFTEAWQASSPEAQAAAATKQAIQEGRAAKIPTRVPASAMEPKVGAVSKIPVTMGEEKLPYPVGATEKIPTTSGEPGAYPVGTQERILVRSPMKPFGAASGATEGGGQLPEVIVAPEPRPPLPGVPPGSMQSVPRSQLAGHIMTGTPGAAEAGQAIGMKPIFLTPGAEFEMAKGVTEPGTFSGRPPVQSNLLQFPGESTPGPMLTGPQIMSRISQINENMGTGTSGVAPRISSFTPEYRGEPAEGLPEVNDRGQKLGFRPIEAKGTPPNIIKEDHPDYNEKGQHLGFKPEVEDVGKKVRTENPEPTREETEKARRKKERDEE